MYAEAQTSGQHREALTRHVAAERARPARLQGLTVYGCERDEAVLFRELSPRFGIVPAITSAAPSAADVVAVPGNRCVSVGHKADVTAPTLRALRDAGVEHLSTRSIGVDHIDLDAAARLGIAVDNVGYAPDGVADYTVMLILMALRHATEIVAAAARHDFRLRPARGRDLRDLTVGVVGLGAIGRAVVQRLDGFGCRVLATSRRPLPAAEAAGRAGSARSGGPAAAAPVEVVRLDELLRASDVVTLHLPLDAATHHVIGSAQLATMKAGAVLVNTGRGALVDTAALVAALEAGRLGGAALDVLEGEDGIFYGDHSTGPLDHDHLVRLQALPHVIVTPHTAYYTERALADTVERTLLRCLDFERNRTHAETEDRDLVRGLLGGA